MRSFKTFLEMYSEPEDSTFGHEGHTYDLNGVLSATLGMPVKHLRVAELKWVLKYDPISAQGEEGQARVDSADLGAPLLVIKDPQEGNKWVVIDGLHRLAKAVNLGLEALPCIIVTQDLIDRYQL